MLKFYKDGVIAIPNVTNDLEITVTAVERIYENLFPNKFFETDGVTVYNAGLGYKNGYRFNSSNAEVSVINHICVTGYLDVTGNSALVISNAPLGPDGLGAAPIICYDSTHSAIGRLGEYSSLVNPNGTYEIPSGAKYIRICCGSDPVDMVVNLE